MSPTLSALLYLAASVAFWEAAGWVKSPVRPA